MSSAIEDGRFHHRFVRVASNSDGDGIIILLISYHTARDLSLVGNKPPIQVNHDRPVPPYHCVVISDAMHAFACYRWKQKRFECHRRRVLVLLHLEHFCIREDTIATCTRESLRCETNPRGSGIVAERRRNSHGVVG